MLAALEILTALIKSDQGMDDLDRTVGMAAYLAKKLEADMSKPIEQLEQEVWPRSEPNAVDTGDAHEHSDQ